MNVNGFLNRFSSEGMLNRNVLISEIILLLYGIFLLVFPAKALHLSVGFIGIVMIIAGVACLVWFFLHRENGNYPLVAIGAIGLIVGVLVMVFRSAIAMILFPIMLGVWTFISTVLAAFAAYGNYRMRTGLWWVPLLAAIVGAVVTVMIFMNLSGTERFMARILGIYFITYNIVRIGEFAVAYLSPAPSAAPREKQINLKDATTLGIVGAGGIGASLVQCLNSRRWAMVGAFVWGLMVLALIIEFFSTRIRRKLAHGE